MSENRAYRAHEVLVRPARARSEIWRLIVGLFTIFAVSILLGIVLRSVLNLLAPGLLRAAAEPSAAQGSTPGTLLLLLFSFGLIIISTFVTARRLQHRNPVGILGAPSLALRQFWAVFKALVVLLIVVSILPPYDMGAPLVPNLDPLVWAMLLPLSLSAILVQVASEEILFRGYIQQSLAARFSSPLIWMVVPSALFGFGHYLPEEAGDNAWMIALWATVFGVLMADLTARAGTLGPAIAVHMVNNVTAILIVSVPDSLNGLALATTPYSMSEVAEMRSWLWIDFALMFISWLAARVAIRR